MDPRPAIAALITQNLVRIRGTGRSFTVDVENVFFQAASYDGNQVLIEVPADEFIETDWPPRYEDLVELGFNRPTSNMPNWWIAIEDGDETELWAAARATVMALQDVFMVDVLTLALAVDLYGPGALV